MRVKGALGGHIIGFISSVLMLSFLSLFLSVYRIAHTDSTRYWFLAWNLFLAWLPLVFAWLLARHCPNGLRWSWFNLVLILLWLLFLPNAFYLLTDLIHLSVTTEINLVFDVVLMASYAICGLVLGYTSLLIVHVKTWQRIGHKSYYLAYGSLLLSGFAIYLGRYLRWNSWDIITNPLGLIFDIGSRIANPAEHIFTFSTTLLFFVFLSVLYFVIWRAAILAKSSTLFKVIK